MISVGPSDDLDACFALRHTVFVREQNVPEDLERDAQDADALHLLAKIDDVPQGAARVLFLGDTAKVGRVCVLQSARGAGVGVALMNEAIAQARSHTGITQVKLGAQTSAIGFYETLGFTGHGPIYLDAGIDHQDMVLHL
jgi:predicted GNAT family N-acyltransferase